MSFKKSEITTEIQVPVGLAERHNFDLSQAIARLTGCRSIAVFMHDNPDPDSMAAAWGLGRLFESELGAKFSLVLAGIVGRAENRAMVEELGIPLVPLAGIDLSQFDALAIVDSQPGAGNNSLPTGRSVDVVVDHHPVRGAVQAAWSDIRAELGATSTIVLQYLRERAIPLDSDLATALFYGLKTETRDLGREASPFERSAYFHLVSLVDHDKLHRICHPKLPRAMQAAKVLGDVVTANLDELFYPDLVAEIADLLMRLHGARFALCAGRYKGKVFVSLRTEVDDSRAGGLIRSIIGSDGSAGGHGTMAGGSLFAPAESADELRTAFDKLVGRLNQALKRTPGVEVPLIP
jgi:nanoRNase/pAp phosphatase (c-di-AMP/oligoRNAs hydrolase)